MFRPSGCTAVGVMSAWWENLLSDSFSENSAVDVKLLVINKLHSYRCKERESKGSSQLHPKCQESTHVHHHNVTVRESNDKQTSSSKGNCVAEEHRNVTPCSSAGILHSPCDTHLKIHTVLTTP